MLEMWNMRNKKLSDLLKVIHPENGKARNQTPTGRLHPNLELLIRISRAPGARLSPVFSGKLLALKSSVSSTEKVVLMHLLQLLGLTKIRYHI